MDADPTPPSGQPCLEPAPTVDLRKLIENSGLGGEDLQLFLHEIAEIFEEDCRNLLAELAAAVACGDVGAATRSAHALKGSASNFQAGAMIRSALELERCAQTDGAAQRLVTLGNSVRETTLATLSALRLAVGTRPTAA